MTKIFKIDFYRILLIVVLCNQITSAQVTMSTDRLQNRIPFDSVTNKSLLNKNLNDLDAHSNYINSMGLNNPSLETQYQEWSIQYPQNPVIPKVIGTAYYKAEMPQAEQFLLKAAALQPGNAELWAMLSDDAERRGEQLASKEYMRKAASADPSDAGYAYYYLATFEDSEPDKYKQMVFDFVKRFPDNRRGAQALYWLAEHSKNINDRIAYFEKLRKLYPPQKFSWSADGMIGLCDAYLQIDPSKALLLVNEMGAEKDWQTRQKLAYSLIEINRLEQTDNFKAALAILDQLQLPKFNYIDNFVALKKTSLQEKAGNARAAYDSLAVKFARLPTDELYLSLIHIGSKTGIDSTYIGKDIHKIRTRNAAVAYPFDLKLYTSGKTLNLNDLKGKVVLLTFWFPGCGPCRAEFPHFQEVINKFKSEDIAFVGINVSPAQDPYVIPFINNTKYSLIPVHGSAEFADKYYSVTNEPENFLIDRNGKIIFKNFRIDDSNHRTLELMISALLEKDISN